jgi:hypothetical protein
MLSEEVFNASLDDGNADVEAKGLRTLGGFHVSVGGRLDKTRRSAHAGSETRLWANHGGRGVCVPRLNLAEAGKAHGGKARVSNRTWENRPSGIIGGPRETWPW